MSFPIEQVRLNSFPVYLFLVTKICNRIDITKQKQQKKSLLFGRLFINYIAKILFYFSYDSLECFRMVNGQVCQNLTVDLDTGSVQSTH